METRLPYYFLSLVVGLIYLVLYLLAQIYLDSTSWIPIIDIIYFIFNIAIVSIFIIKDAFDEQKIRENSAPVGPNWFEHSTFILMVAIQCAISIQYDTIDLITYVKAGLFILALIDFVWDIIQDERAHSYR